MWGLLIMVKLFHNFDATTSWTIIGIVSVISFIYKLKKAS